MALAYFDFRTTWWPSSGFLFEFLSADSILLFLPPILDNMWKLKRFKNLAETSFSFILECYPPRLRHIYQVRTWAEPYGTMIRLGFRFEVLTFRTWTGPLRGLLSGVGYTPWMPSTPQRARYIRTLISHHVFSSIRISATLLIIYEIEASYFIF